MLLLNSERSKNGRFACPVFKLPKTTRKPDYQISLKTEHLMSNLLSAIRIPDTSGIRIPIVVNILIDMSMHLEFDFCYLNAFVVYARISRSWQEWRQAVCEGISRIDIHAGHTWRFPRGKLKSAQLLPNSSVSGLK